MTHASFRLTRRSLLAAASAAPLSIVLCADAQDRWPSRPVTIVSPYTPGGTNDIPARLMADRLQKAFGQAFIVDNRAGAAGVVGTQSVIRAKPDGYTLIAGNNGSLIVQSAGRQPSPYDPLKQLTPIMRVAEAMQFIAVSSEVPVKNVAELIALAKKEPGKLNYTSSGIGSFGHFLAEYLKIQAAIDIVHVPSKGSAAGLTELMSGRIQMMIDPVVLTQASDPRIRILATVGGKRTEAYPQYPTMKESGGPDLDLTGWFGLQGPAGLPPEIVARIADVGKGLPHDAEAHKAFTAAGLVPAFLSGEPYAELIRDDLRKVAEIRTRAKIALD